MTEKKGKRAVIISNIKSDSIEQAIFILRNSSYEDTSADIGCGIVAEAQEIINSYINTIEKSKKLRKRRDCMKTALPVTLLGIAAAIVTALLILF